MKQLAIAALPSLAAGMTGGVHLPGSLHLGQSPTGVTITYPIPLTFQPVAVMGYAVTKAGRDDYRRKKMKRLAVISLLGITMLAISTPPRAQVPNVQITFDAVRYQTNGFCKGIGVLDTLFVVARNFNILMSSIEYAIEPPAQDAAWAGDLHRPGALFLGQSSTGVTITYPIPLNAFSPVVVMRYAIIWVCSDCDQAVPYVPIKVIGHPYTGIIEAIEWNTYRKVPGVGMTSYFCYLPFATEPTTWGRVKSLHQ
jgi:hypothetical protein